MVFCRCHSRCSAGWCLRAQRHRFQPIGRLARVSVAAKSLFEPWKICVCESGSRETKSSANEREIITTAHSNIKASKANSVALTEWLILEFETCRWLFEMSALWIRFPPLGGEALRIVGFVGLAPMCFHNTLYFPRWSCRPLATEDWNVRNFDSDYILLRSNPPTRIRTLHWPSHILIEEKKSSLDLVTIVCTAIAGEQIK